MKNNDYRYFISQDDENEQYWLWSFDPKSPSLFKKVTGIGNDVLPKGEHLMQVGNYILQWSPLIKNPSDPTGKNDFYNYRLLEFDPNRSNPLGSIDSQGNWQDKALQSGKWLKRKFFGSRSDFANPDGANKGFESGTELVLLSLHNFVLNWIPTPGRGTYQLFNFDHGSSDPLPAAVTPQGAWQTIQSKHKLIHIHGYVLDWATETGAYSLWQFDAQNSNPLSYPAVQKGNLKDYGIDEGHELIPIGDHVLDWETKTNRFRLWEFDREGKKIFKGPVSEGTLPDEITSSAVLTAIETLISKNESRAKEPGTMDYMRDKIEHVVYYMIENRSFDHVCGWLYDKDAKINVIGPKGPFNGVDKNFTNTFNGKKYAITQYNDGKLPKKLTYKNGKPCYAIPGNKDQGTEDQCFQLDLDTQDPYHDNSDVMRQMFSDIEDYHKGKKPDMQGFALNNGTEEVMLGYSPEQLPVLNGLAENFAISDEWFCSMPGGTDVNRAFALTGSSLGHLNNFQNGVEYTEWYEYPHRPSIWKVLWSNGISDFKIYNAVEWIGCQFTYNLFLKGQIPTIDGPFDVGNYAPQLNQFYDDLKYGTLPKFSFLEPKWVASAGSTSYHPGNDLIPGERTLRDIFEAIQESPLRDKTLLVITFDEHGGIADHVQPPYAKNPFVNDSIDGFNFDIMGVRIPTVLVSPWITKNTVFRSETETKYDSTSILATLLDWSGIPRSRWGLGERVNHAPTFEAVIQEKEARKEKIKLKVPYDSKFPLEEDLKHLDDKPSGKELPVNGIHELTVPRIISDMTPKLTHAERARITEEIMSQASNQEELHGRLDQLHKEHMMNK